MSGFSRLCFSFTFPFSLLAAQPSQAARLEVIRAPHDTVLGSSSVVAPTATAEGRALWVTRFDYNSEAKIVYIMETAARAHFNIIYFQARAAGGSMPAWGRRRW